MIDGEVRGPAHDSSGGSVLKSSTQEAKEHGPKGYIAGGAFFIVVGIVIAVHALLDPARVSVRGAPFWVLSVLLLVGGLPLLIAGLRARRDLTK
jgi:hypothetical protein